MVKSQGLPARAWEECWEDGLDPGAQRIDQADAQTSNRWIGKRETRDGQAPGTASGIGGRAKTGDRGWQADGETVMAGAWGGDKGARGSARPPLRWDPAPRMAGPARSVAIDPPHANHHLRFQDTHRHFAMSRIKQPFQRPAAPPRLHCAGCCAANVSDASDPERRFTQGAAFASKRSHRQLRDARPA